MFPFLIAASGCCYRRSGSRHRRRRPYTTQRPRLQDPRQHPRRQHPRLDGSLPSEEKAIPTREKRAPATAKKKKAPDISAANLSHRKKKPSPLEGKERQPQPKKESAGHLSGKSLPTEEKADPTRGKSASHNQKRKHRTSQRQISTRKKRPSPRGGKERQLSHEEAAPAISAANLPSEEKPAPRGGKERQPQQRRSAGHIISLKKDDQQKKTMI